MSTVPFYFVESHRAAAALLVHDHAMSHVECRAGRPVFVFRLVPALVDLLIAFFARRLYVEANAYDQALSSVKEAARQSGFMAELLP